MKHPIKLCLKSEIIPLLILGAAVVMAIATYDNLPDLVATHWNFAGQVDGWGPRGFQAFFIPGLLGFIYLLFLLMPAIDPRKENYRKMAKFYNIFKNLLLGALFIVYAATTLFNLGYDLNIGQIISLTIGIMIVAIGFLIRKIRDNWFIGIRTPWTLSSHYVWKKTHNFSSWLFMAFGLIIIISPYLKPWLGIGLFVIGALSLFLGTFIYSYIIFSQEKKNKRR